MSEQIPGCAQQVPDLTTLSADFLDPASLAPWCQHAPEGFSPKWRAPRLANGRLLLQPVASRWFDDNQAGHLYREVTGDFIVTTRIRVSGTYAELPQSEFSLAGVFVRAPRVVSAASWEPGKENWFVFSVGTATPVGEPHYEVKSTTNSLSTLKIVASQLGWVELRVARHGELFTLLDRPEGRGEWRVVDQIIRADLPISLLVGFTAYADWSSVELTYFDPRVYNEQGAGEGNADLIAEIDWVRFDRPAMLRFSPANFGALSTFCRDLIEARRRDLFRD